MKIIGYSGTDQPIHLDQITICGNTNEFRALGRFFLKCADEQERFPPGSWDHVHFSDVQEGWGIDGPEIIANKPI